MDKHGRKDKDMIAEEAKRYLQRQLTEQEMCFAKWAKTDVGAGLKDLYVKNPNKARRVAKALSTQEAHLKQLNETIISQDFQTTPENVLKIVRIGTANSHRGDIFTEVPLSTTDDALYFIDMTYHNTITDKQQTAAEKIYEKAYYTSAGTAGKKSQAGDNSTSQSITTGNGYLIPLKVRIIVDGELCAEDDGAGALTALSGNGATVTGGTVNYTSGAIVVTSTSVIASTSTVVVYYEWDSEQSTNFTNYPKVGLTVSRKRFEATPQPLGYEYSTMTEILLGTTGLGDAEALLIGAVGDEHAKYKDYKAIRIARNVAKKNQAYVFNTDFAAEGEVSDKLHAQKILSVVNDIGGDIYDDIKRGAVNKIVAGQRAVTYMQKHDLWSENAGANRTGVFMAGKLGSIDVYQCPADAALVANNEMLLTFKNPNEGLDVGLAFGVLTEITAKLAYPQFYVDANIASVEDYMVINSKFVRLLSLNNLPDYNA